MHIRNAWLPPPVMEKTENEIDSFSFALKSLSESWRVEDPDSVYDTLKWVPLIELFIYAKSEVNLAEIQQLVELGLQIFYASRKKLYAQVKWANVLAVLLKKNRSELSVVIDWRIFYDTLSCAYFTRNTRSEGWKLKVRHLKAVRSLVQCCRRFFAVNSAFEIWTLFSTYLNNPWHDPSFEGAGFLKLLMPVNAINEDFYSENWIQLSLGIWGKLPNCHFWDKQWITLFARCIKHCNCINWEKFLPILFTRFLNLFKIPVAGETEESRNHLHVPQHMKYVFSSTSDTLSKSIAKSIVYLLRPKNSAQVYLERLVTHLELFYHPSNGGSWTPSLEQFLHYLVFFFQKRLRSELGKNSDKQVQHCLGAIDRTAFVRVVLRLMKYGQYSKNESLAVTVANAASNLAYVEPSLLFPFIASSFHLALNTATATHQLRITVTSVALACRALFLFSSEAFSPVSLSDWDPSDSICLIRSSLSTALLAIDANDPPKTSAAFRLIVSVLSNVTIVENNEAGYFILAEIDFSGWIDEFFFRLFSLFHNLELPSNLNDEVNAFEESRSLFAEEGQYFLALELLLSKLSIALYKQALQQISKFVRSSFLPGAALEVGILCCACVHSCPKEAIVYLLEPLLLSVTSVLKDGGVASFTECPVKASFSSGLEVQAIYYLKLLAVAINHGGPILLCCKDSLMEVLALGLKASSWKVNNCCCHLLDSLLCSLVQYYPMDQFKFPASHTTAAAFEEWVCSKDDPNMVAKLRPRWHIPNNGEILFANEVLHLHLDAALDNLLKLFENKVSSASVCKEHAKVLLLQVRSSLQGVSFCLPDFMPYSKHEMASDQSDGLIAGSCGATVGSTELREKAAKAIHICCRALLESDSDNSVMLGLIIQIMCLLGCSECLDSEYLLGWWNSSWNSLAFVEPPTNFVSYCRGLGKKRPRWAVISQVYMHNKWRSSQASFYMYQINPKLSPPIYVVYIMEDLLNLCVHNYDTVRIYARRALVKMLKRWPCLISRCIITLTDNLQDPSAPEHTVLGSCDMLSTGIILRHLSKDFGGFSSFLLGLLSSSIHKSTEEQKAINKLFFKYNNEFSGLSRNMLRSSFDNNAEAKFEVLVSQIMLGGCSNNHTHWRYTLMADRMLLLLVMAATDCINLSVGVLFRTIGHFREHFNSPLPQGKVLAIFALNALFHEFPRMVLSGGCMRPGQSQSDALLSLEESLRELFKEKYYFSATCNDLSNVHMLAYTENPKFSSGNDSMLSFLSSGQSILTLRLHFSSFWPHIPSWISHLSGHAFCAEFATFFKHVIQECGMEVLLALKATLEDFINSTERSKQCVASEMMAGILQSDVNGLLDAWDDWILCQLEKVIHGPSVDSMREWAACLQYAVMGKGLRGNVVPMLRQRILDCLVKPLPAYVSSNVIMKRYMFLSIALLEISASDMSIVVVQIHEKLLVELIDSWRHPSVQVREAVGIILSVVYSNMQVYHLHRFAEDKDGIRQLGGCYGLVDLASEIANNMEQFGSFTSIGPSICSSNVNTIFEQNPENMWWIETMLYFVIYSAKSGRSSVLIDKIIDLLYPIISLQEAANNELALLAKSAFELMKWITFPVLYLKKAIHVIFSLFSDDNWKTRYVAITCLHALLYRHIFSLSDLEKQSVVDEVEKLLVDRQIEVREHAARLLASLMTGEDESLAVHLREWAFSRADAFQKKQNRRNANSNLFLSELHGAILSLAASLLSAPYDIPRWLPNHVMLLTRFINEPPPIPSTVRKALAEFHRTHADTWSLKKDCFSEAQLEALADVHVSSSYFA